MKYGRGKWVYGSFALLARDAARRFAFGRSGVPRRRGSWRPLVLRWRQRRKHRENMTTVRAATAAPVLWFPQFHFHYATFPKTLTRCARWSTLASGAGTPETRVVVDHHWTSVRAGTLPPQASRAFRPLSLFYSRHISPPKREAGLMNTADSSRPTGAQSIVPPVAHRPGPTIMQRQERTPVPTHSRIWRNWLQIFRRRPPAFDYRVPDRSSPNTVMQRQERTLFERHSRMRQDWLQIFRRRPPAFDYRVPDRSSQNTALRVQFDGPEELVWRRRMRPATAVAEVEGSQELSDSFQRPALRTFQSEEEANRSALFAPAALQITKIDPGLLDRLTDDVIRRVEQRARIERQRRGL